MDKSETKQHIYEVAKTLFYKQGYSSTTMRNIAKISNNSLGLPLYYFGSKEGLGVEIYKEYRLKLRAACRRYYPLPEQAEDCAYLCIVADNALLLDNSSLMDLYVNIAHSVEMSDFMYEFLPWTPSPDELLEKFNHLNALTVPAVKATIINASFEKYNIDISKEDLLFFLFYRYIRFQKYIHIESVKDIFYKYYEIYKSLNFQLLENFELKYTKV